jgi:hypothetical protein
LTIQPIEDPSWALKANPLLAFLDEPRTWGDLSRWCQEQHITVDWARQALAWLEEKGFACTLKVGGHSVADRTDKGDARFVRWVRSNYLTERSSLVARGFDPVVPVGLIQPEEMSSETPPEQPRSRYPHQHAAGM